MLPQGQRAWCVSEGAGVWAAQVEVEGGLREEDGLGKGCRKQGGQGSEEKGCMSGKEMAWRWPGQRRGQWDCQRQSGQRE